MISAVFNTVIFDPLYNGLVFFVGVIPTHDMGLAVIALTIVVRILLIPLSRRAVETQLAMKKVAPEVEELKKKHKKNSPELNQAIFALYKERDIHPFANMGLVLIQLPLLFGLYWVFLQAGFPEIKPDLLYSFVNVPPSVNMHFLGLIDMGANHNIILAVLVALTQFVYSRLAMGPREAKPKSTPVEATFSGDMARSFDLQARYVFPVLFGVISYFVASAAPLYWVTSNTFMIAQEYFAGRRF
ncbi:MAG: YidC/Oxa1 family membrane protein insertase [Patescibacteria group bacterium]|nr:YidC/Oxa1 family membrane protein insertase [Patescibacteria group bacterium]